MRDVSSWVDYTLMNAEQFEALQTYRLTEGRCWKARLRAAWMRADAPPALMQLRNAAWFGPAGLIGWPSADKGVGRE